MNWNKLRTERCPVYNCGQKLEYNRQIEEYSCQNPECKGFSTYLRNFKRLIVSPKQGFDYQYQKAEAIDFFSEMERQTSSPRDYYFAKNGEYPLTGKYV